MAKISDSTAKGKRCPACKSSDVRGMPSPVGFKRYRTFRCASCSNDWTEGHRGYVGAKPNTPLA